MALTRFQEQTLCFFPPHCSRLDEGGEAFPKSNDLLNSGRNKPSLPGSTEVNKHNEASGS